jgi:glycosyltransferase involved in cell wall biosynthesis
VEQAAFLPRLGIDMVVIGGPGATIAEWFCGAPRVEFVHSRNFPGAWPAQRYWRRLTLPFRYVQCGLRVFREVRELLKRERFDVVVASLPFAWIAGTLAARFEGVPIIWRAGGARLSRWERAGLWALTRFLRPDLLLCNGEAVKRTFAPLVPADVAIVQNGIDWDRFGNGHGLRSPSKRPRGAKFVLGYAGRLAPSKRPEDLIALAARLAKAHPDLQLLIAGEGSSREQCERLARRSSPDNVTFLGFVSDMPAFFAACDAIVLTSQSEGCSTTILEAMASRKPVVVSDIPALRELVTDGENGLVYPLGDVDALTSAVCRLVECPALCRVLGRRGHERAAQFTVPVAAARLSAVLRDVAARHQASRG